MSARIVSAKDAEEWEFAEDNIPDDVATALAHTVVVQAEQIAAVLALMDEWEQKAAAAEDRFGVTQSVHVDFVNVRRSLGVTE